MRCPGAANLSGDLGALIDALNRPPRRRGQAVVVSDFLVPPAQWERPLRKLAVRHDVLAIEIVDPRELALDDAGVLEFVDPETGRLHEVHTGDAKLRQRYAAGAAAQRSAIASAIRGAGAAHLRLRTDRDWLLDIVRFVAAQRAAIADAVRAAGAAHLRLRTDSDWLLDIVRFVAAQRHARTRGTTR